MKIIVMFDLEEDSEAADPGHPMGVTNDAFDTLHQAVCSIGGDDINVEKQ